MRLIKEFLSGFAWRDIPEMILAIVLFVGICSFFALMLTWWVDA